MYFASALVLALSASFHGATSTPDGTFESYTQAYRTAADVKRPLLVVLNPAPKEGETQETISIADLRTDAGISDLLANYVVAEINTGTEHGQKVHELFGSKALPRVVVIDSDQKQQIYRTSEHLEQSEIKDVLQKYRSGKRPVTTTTLNWNQQFTPGYCPNCQKF